MTEFNIIPAPLAPAPGFTKAAEAVQAAITAEAADLDGFHGHLIITGRRYITPEDGAVWWEAQDEPGTLVWVSWDVAPDPRAPEAATPTALTGWVDELGQLYP